MAGASSRSINPEREYENPYKDFDQNVANSFIDSNQSQVLESFKSQVLQKAKELMNEISVSKNAQDISNSGCSLYTGMAGIALVALMAGRRIDSKYNGFAKDLLVKACKDLSGRRISFLNGDLGTLALSLEAFDKSEKNYSKSLLNLERLQSSMLQYVKDPSSEHPDEILYGRAGFLYGMLYINKHTKQNFFSEEDIREVIQCILIRGKSLSKRQKALIPLMYEWHDKVYLGAAHGIVGIMYVLLQARAYLNSHEISNLIRPTIDDLLSKRFPSGNLPSSLGNNSDRLVQWCHGAPGFVSLLALAYEVFGEESYLTAAENCADVIWERGLLRKGCGLCHGTGGNAFAFIALYKLYKAKGSELNAAKHLYRACAFTDWCLEYRKHRERLPDRPLSLFEGKSGILYLFLSILEPENATFPAYDL